MRTVKFVGVFVLIAVICVVLICLLGSLGLFSLPGAEPAEESSPFPTLPMLTPSPEPTPEPTAEIPCYASDELWKLAIASVDYPMSGAYPVSTVAVDNTGYLFDARAADALEAMLDGARADGVSLYITSAWRSRATQAQLYENRVYRFQLEGYSREEAEIIGATVVARPGTSEHELGLSVDLLTQEYQVLDSGFAETAAYDWLQEHCAEYGFVERYPEGKGDLTGIIWEPWHYRYVGVEVAQYIMENGLCLEEYLDRVDLLPA